MPFIAVTKIITPFQVTSPIIYLLAQTQKSKYPHHDRAYTTEMGITMGTHLPILISHFVRSVTNAHYRLEQT
jgi:hypothetical protein